MDKTASPFYLYQEEEVIDDAEHTVFEYTRQQSYCYVLTTVIRTITVANIVGVMLASRENYESMANCVEQILRLKKRDFEAAEKIGTPA